MKDIFHFINNSLFNKKPVPPRLHEEEISLPPYLLQRWCSMCSRETTPIINLTTNRWLFTMSKVNVYRLFVECLPKQKRQKISYIKKASKQEQQESVFYPDLEISKREFISNQETLNFINNHDKME